MSSKNSGMTATELIIARHANRERVKPGEIVNVSVDMCMSNDATTLLTEKIMKDQMKTHSVWEPSRVVIIVDHQVPADSIDTSIVQQGMARFVDEQGIKNFHTTDGVCHQVMLENHVYPGALILGADSHTCSYGSIGAVSSGVGSTDLAAIWASGETWLKVPETVRFILEGQLKPFVSAKDVALHIINLVRSNGLTYKTMELSGPGIALLSVPERFTICNMAVEAGAKSTMIIPDDAVIEFFKQLGRPFDDQELLSALKETEDAPCHSEIKIDLSELEPLVACPHYVDNVKPLSEIKGLKINQAFLGSCTNGRIEDLREGAKLIKGKTVAPHMRFLVTPASVKVYKQALKEDLINTFLDSGAVVNHPGCSTCWGAHQGILAPGQRMVTSGNRNFKGRAGSPESEIYLASPSVVVASAIKGEMTHPKEVL
ncbi:Homoaconitase/3-isopropylmalate dehydratase, large subunit, prokaryotic [Candidatus Magnetomorum sp. HK-1]|nr:Homoaconitase/3-isopropylmalate dehydratase, large subunit, prokaryotic [Candidatus Magnetomorum sp. HK-1]